MNEIEVIKKLLNAMDMQEKRESEEFHIPQKTAKAIWDEAKEDAIQYLAEKKVYI